RPPAPAQPVRHLLRAEGPEPRRQVPEDRRQARERRRTRRRAGEERLLCAAAERGPGAQIAEDSMSVLRRISHAALVAALAVVAVPAGAQDGTTRERRATTPEPSHSASPKAGSTSGQRRDVPPDADPIQLATDVVNVLFTVTDERNRFV